MAKTESKDKQNWETNLEMGCDTELGVVSYTCNKADSSLSRLFYSRTPRDFENAKESLKTAFNVAKNVFLSGEDLVHPEQEPKNTLLYLELLLRLDGTHELLFDESIGKIELYRDYLS